MKPFPLATDENEKKAREFVPGKLLKPSLIIVSKIGTCLNGAPFRCSPLWQAPDLTRLYKTKLEELARDRYSSLFCPFICDERKKF
jgi:hypothetical protein